MPHEIYDVNSGGSDYFETSHRLQAGYGHFQGMLYQRGHALQRGRGVLGVIKKAWKYLGPLAQKYVAPLAKKALRALADEGVETGHKVLGDVMEGTDVKEALKTHGKAAAKSLMRKAGSTLTQAGSRGGRVRKTKKTPKPKKISKRSLANLRLVGQSVLESAAKRGRRANTLGLY